MVIRYLFILSMGVVVGSVMTWGLHSYNTDYAPSQKLSANEKVGNAGFSNTVGKVNSEKLPVIEQSLQQSVNQALLHPSAFTKTTALYNLLAGLDEKQLLDLLATIDWKSQTVDDQILRGALYTRLLDVNPERVLEELLSKPGINSQQWLGYIFQYWARADLEAAIFAIVPLSPGQKATALFAVFSARPDLSREQQISLAERAGTPGFIGEWDRQAWLNLAKADPNLAWANAMQIVGFSERRTALLDTAYYWGQSDPVAALSAINSVDELDLRSDLQVRIVQEWAKLQSAQAVEWVLQNQDYPQHDNMLRFALGELAKVDPNLAIELATNTAGVDATLMLGPIIERWSQQDVEAASRWIADADPSFVTAGMIADAAAAFSKQNPVAALSWAISLTEKQGFSAVSDPVRELVHINPEYAANLIQRIKNPKVQQVARLAQVEMLVGKDINAALKLVEASPPNQRATMIETLMSTWAKIDLNAATSYLVDITDEEIRNKAAISILRNYSLNLNKTTIDNLLSRIDASSMDYLIAKAHARMHALR